MSVEPRKSKVLATSEYIDGYESTLNIFLFLTSNMMNFTQY